MTNVAANTSSVAPASVSTPAVAKPASKPVAAKADKPATVKPVAKAAAKPVSAPVAAKPDASAAKRDAVKADRATIDALYATFETSRLSVPVKPVAGYKLTAATAHPIARNPSARQAAAIAVAFSAAGKKLIDGATAPRVFDRNGRGFVIETGVLRDAISAGLITVSGATPATEILTIAKNATKAIAGLIGSKAMQAGRLA